MTQDSDSLWINIGQGGFPFPYKVKLDGNDDNTRGSSSLSPSVPDSQRFLPFLAVTSWNMLKATEPFDAPQGKWNETTYG